MTEEERHWKDLHLQGLWWHHGNSIDKNKIRRLDKLFHFLFCDSVTIKRK